jgi:hypothetical protein
MFMVRTLSQGATLPLDDPFVLEAVRQLHKPVVILDTAIRFSGAADENSALQNAWMEKSIRSLREAGCIAVVALHHSPKRTEDMGAPTLENTFRGTSDIGALLDLAYSIRTDREMKISGEGERIVVQCVKARDMEDAPTPFILGLKHRRDGETNLRSFIDETGDMVLMAETRIESPRPDDTRTTEKARAKRIADEDAEFQRLVRLDPTISQRSLQAEMHLGRKAVKATSERLGFDYENGRWVGPPAPKSTEKLFEPSNALVEVG